MVRVIAVMVAFLSSVQLAQACLSPGEEIYDPGEYVARFYECPSLSDVGQLALAEDLLARWNRAVANDLIDQPFVIMGNDYEITDLSVLEHAVRTPNPRSIEIVIRARFKNFGEPQTIDWLFFDDLSDEAPFVIVDIQGVSPFTYSLADTLRSFGK
ncbi:MAG: hypothetical protein JJ908_13815 [Rhizobiales bacterium]|nr:hypothetical protein [Hyphomicrobiales bacterium]MBO6699904.1 hypothetical protein [Hyphomicrobiales bacterium]MBO6737442.1 hypothetical protein [Hyphomicrobiales bacterium]MBO6911484.1 hypothetical protein [Hyphomicrobiales bacterium]MBO6955216.1 hypothetical protein [Hyphomicrobiales bacterium]